MTEMKNKISLSEIEINSIGGMIDFFQNANNVPYPPSIRMFGKKHPEFDSLLTAFSDNRSKENHGLLISWLKQKTGELR